MARPPSLRCSVQGACAVPRSCPRLFRSISWVFGLFVSCPQVAPAAHACSYFLVPYNFFFCILLLQERSVQVQALQERSWVPSLPHGYWSSRSSVVSTFSKHIFNPSSSLFEAIALSFLYHRNTSFSAFYACPGYSQQK